MKEQSLPWILCVGQPFFLSPGPFSAIQKFYTFDKKFVLGMIFEILYNLVHRWENIGGEVRAKWP